MKKFFSILTLCTAISASVTASESLTTSYYNGNAPVLVDGDLSDWSALGLAVTEITRENEWTMVTSPDNADDLSAEFRCFIDNSFLYVGVEVRDDVLVFGQESFEYSWNDDAVDIKLDGDRANIEKMYYDANDFQVRISRDNTGATTLEGMVPFVNPLQIPTLWEKAGVRAVLKPSSHGYAAEAAIPLYLLGYASGSEVSAIGMNVQVYDDDNSGDFDHQLSWADDPDNVSWKCTRQHNIVQFSEMSSSALKTVERKPVQTDVSIVLNEPLNTFSYGDIVQSLEYIHNGKFADAERHIDNIDADNSIIKGVLYKQIENSDKAFMYLNRVSDDSGTRIGRYVLTNKYGLADDKVALYQKYLKSKEKLTNHELSKINDFIIVEYIKSGRKDMAAQTILTILNGKIYDPITVDGWCKDLQDLGYYSDAIEYLNRYLEINNKIHSSHYYLLVKRISTILIKMKKYQEAIDKIKIFTYDSDYCNDANILISNIYYLMGHYSEAEDVINKLIINDAYLLYNANMIKYSIKK